MSDVFDQASEKEDKDREEAIRVARRKAAVLPDIGACYFCDSPTADGHRFCDAGCRDDYEREQKHKRIQGRR